jgi:hypothetical protein
VKQWVHVNETAKLYAKGEGPSQMVADITADTGEYIDDAYSLAMFWHILNMELHRQFTHIDYPI